MKRTAGILLPVFSLPSKYGIGCFDKTAFEFVDFLKNAGQSYWQILPLCPTGFGDSPYQSFSSFAGNPYFISLDELVQNGWLTEDEINSADFSDSDDSINYEKLYRNRYPLLKKAYSRSNISENSDFRRFCEENDWLYEYALFMSLKDKNGGKVWNEWTEMTPSDTEFYCFLQFVFYSQWQKLKNYANSKGIKIIGDIPIYTAFDSADVWSNPHLFQLDKNNLPTAVAGCPPDGFAAEGQLWGNPLYKWEVHKQSGYEWWIKRLSHAFRLYDVLRIDHFRGFDEYYAIPYGSENAINGRWEKGPGIEFFKAFENTCGRKNIIAEDLGFMTDSVKRLVKECGFPNMKVLEFAFDSRDTSGAGDHLPHNYSENSVAYTGTHDNQTLSSWFDTITEEERQMVREYLCDGHTPDSELNKPLISLIMRSPSKLCIIPIQDYLGLKDFARINIPSTVGNNWKWRVEKGQLSNNLCENIMRITKLYGR